jgi:peptidylprolyl isomerase
MGTEKRQRQKEGRQARIAAAEAAQHRADRRRRYITFAVVAVAVLGVFALINFLTKKDDKKTVATGTSSTTASPTATLASVAGKPCVAMKGTPPKGAPSVPVEVGKPPTKLVVKDLKVGTGPTVVAADTTSINYIGVSCSTGKIFDSSYSRNTPYPTTLDASGQVIDGWKQGIPGMKIGGERLLGIPAALGYKDNPAPGSGIAPGETLWFVVSPVSSAPTTTTAAPPSSTAATTSTSPASK